MQSCNLLQNSVHVKPKRRPLGISHVSIFHEAPANSFEAVLVCTCSSGCSIPEAAKRASVKAKASPKAKATPVVKAKACPKPKAAPKQALDHFKLHDLPRFRRQPRSRNLSPKREPRGSMSRLTMAWRREPSVIGGSFQCVSSYHVRIIFSSVSH